jgi:uncharacterized coiled-coil DUF342 family protein
MEKGNLGKLRKDISDLTRELTKIKAEKENWFKEKEELKKQISDQINKIKTVKSETDSFNVVLRELKKKRDECNKVVKNFISGIKDLRKKRKDVEKKLGVVLSPDSIKGRIKKLEETVETEVLTIKKEEKLMSEIKELKKSLSEGKALVELDEKIIFISKRIDEFRKKSQEFHVKLKDHIKNHRKGKGYREFISLSKQIDFLKASQKKAFGMFIDMKNKFFALNKILRYKSFEEKKVKSNIESNNIKREEYKKQKEEKLLDEKYRKIEETLKTKKKLTTNDLLAMRR